MVELFQSFWGAIKSGDAQTLLYLLGAVLTASLPVITKIVKGKIDDLKIRLEAKSQDVRELKAIAQALINNQKYVNEALKSFEENNAEIWNYVLDHSTLTDAQKAYAKDTYVKAIKVVEQIDLSAFENKKDDELPTQTPTEEITEDTPVGL